MTRRVQLVLLCEDSQHEAFARRFLAKAGWDLRRLRVEKAPRGRGSAAQFVRQRFPRELAAYRKERGRVELRIVVLVDGDHPGVTGRQQELESACQAAGIPPRQTGENVAIFIPTWNLETWLAYLDGQTVDERRPDYPRLPRARDCQRHVDALWTMCQQAALRSPAPASLEAACQEYRARL